MNRNLLVTFTSLALLVSGCDDKITQARMFPNGGGQSDGGGSDGATKPHVPPDPKCNGACCPTDPACATTPTTYSGPECLAQVDNTKQNRWQLRQTWSYSALPVGNATDLVGFILSRRSAFTWPACNMNTADVGTFMQLVDFDLTTNTGRVGFSTYTPGTDLTNEITNGLCMAAGSYTDAGNPPLIANLAMGADWPVGLPPPMLLPWNAAPTKAKGVPDFDYATQRKDILAKFAPGGEYAGYTGIFFLDQERGYLHGFAPIAYVVVYDTATQYNIIPIRESEITAQLNDPAHPNCVGIYRGDALDPLSNCAPTASNPAWGCPNDECAIKQGPNVTKGYFLITEIEQVHNPTLSETICALDVTAQTPNVLSGKDCRTWPNWDPTKPDTGLPMGDWCAETNSAATQQCHNAFRSISYATFQGFKIKENTTCPP